MSGGDKNVLASFFLNNFLLGGTRFFIYKTHFEKIIRT